MQKANHKSEITILLSSLHHLHLSHNLDLGNGQLALWVGTSQGCVLLVNLTMPDNEDDRVLQLQSVNAIPIRKFLSNLRIISSRLILKEEKENNDDYEQIETHDDLDVNRDNNNGGYQRLTNNHPFTPLLHFVSHSFQPLKQHTHMHTMAIQITAKAAIKLTGSILHISCFVLEPTKQTPSDSLSGAQMTSQQSGGSLESDTQISSSNVSNSGQSSAVGTSGIGGSGVAGPIGAPTGATLRQSDSSSMANNQSGEARK